ncbi:hypothetical protein DAPPUDRAFT_106728 [Daphnia pulex]|uniref:Uncharacterized protein n=1 Tax=Daphnia pulex TaxID=6669 RepID=E9GUD9_DAPPU|nr:hypothetical protein DAPPUDRAFT_106728 [Daphnia pulex]|eukprot:EFX76815.1 hypothetical protein DAPPUDRAFT_106728 [Daphnia pulex]
MKAPATEEDGLLDQYIDGLASFLAKHGTLRQSVIPPRKSLEIGGDLDGKEKGKEAGEEVAVTQLSPFATVNNFYTTVNIAFKAGVDQLSRKFITRRLHSAGIKSRIAAVKDVFMEEYRPGRLQFARHYVNMPIVFLSFSNFLLRKIFVLVCTRSSIHRENRTQRLNEQAIRLIALDWPIKGTDLSPFENLWGYLIFSLNEAHNSDGMQFHAKDARKSDELFLFVSEKWNDLNATGEYLEKLVDSMPVVFKL